MSIIVNINVCRVCMKYENGKSILEDEILKKKFLYTTRLMLNSIDNMPTKICPKCVMRLQVSYDFIQLAHASEKNLKQFLMKISNDFQLVRNGRKSEIENCNTTDTDSDSDSLLLYLHGDTIKLNNPIVETEITNSLSNVVNSAPVHNESYGEKSDRSSGSLKSTNISHLVNNQQGDITIIDKLMVSPEEEENEVVCDLLNYENCDFTLIPQDGDDDNDDDAHIIQYDDQIEQENFIETNDNGEKDIDDESDNAVVALISEGDNNKEISLQFDKNEEKLTENSQELNMEENMNTLINNNTKKEYEILDENDDDQEAQKGEYSKDYEAMLIDESIFIQENNTTQTNTGTYTLNTIDFQESTHTIINTPTNGICSENNSVAVVDDTSIATTMTAVSLITNSPDKFKRKRKLKTKDNPNTSLDITNYFCHKCNRDFSTRTNLTRHMLIHDGVKPFNCETCGKGFNQNTSLKSHMYTHTGEKPFVCDVCNRGFTQCKSLIFHKRRHTGDKPFPCDICGLFFRQKDGLKNHILKYHLITEEDICIICKKDLGDKVALQAHMKQHLNNHKPINSNENCVIMEDNILMDFIVQDDNDNSEDLLHANDDSVLMEIADSTVHIVDVMGASAAEPSRAKKFQCRKCFKCFNLKKSLLRHLKIHEEYPIGLGLNQCNECQMSFVTNTELDYHISLMHQQKCPICTHLEFKTQGELMEHMLEH